MTQDRVSEDEALVRRSAHAFGRALADGEIEPFVQLLDEEVEFEIASPMKGGAVSFHGRDQVRRYLGEMAAEYTELELTPHEVRVVDPGRFLVLGVWRGRVGAGTRFGTPLATIIELRDNRVSRVRGFLDEQQALAAVGS